MKKLNLMYEIQELIYEGLLIVYAACPIVASTESPSWGHSKVILGAIRSFLEPFCEHLSPKLTRSLEN